MKDARDYKISLKLLLIVRFFIQAIGIILVMNNFLHVACTHSTSYLLPHSRKAQASVDERKKKKKNQYLSRIITNIFTRWIENYSWKQLTLKTWLVTCCLGEIQIRKNSLDILTRTTTFALAFDQLWYRTLYNQKCFQ